MTNLWKMSACLSAVLLVTAIFGCGSKPPANSSAGKVESGPSVEEEIAANLAKLSPEDRELAVKQNVCPVSGERLGIPGMGAPPKVDVKGHTVFICCDSCKQPLLDEADKFLAKLGMADAAK